VTSARLSGSASLGGADVAGPAFTELFADRDQATELSWGSAPLEFMAAKIFRRALSVDVVEGWLDCSLLQHPFLKVFLGGRQLPVRQWGSPRAVKGQLVTGFVDGEKTRGLFTRGATLMFCNLHEWHAPCRELCRALTEKLVAEVKATAFYGPPGRQGLDTHRDDAHVFVAQLGGAKRWSVFDVPSDPQSRRIGPVDPAECGIERVVTLGAGEGLYLPPYAAHHARSLPSASSLHLAIAVREPVTRDVVDVALNEVLTAEAQRVEISGDAKARATQVGTILNSVARQLVQLDPAELVAALEERFIRL
jgi:ribosomal protein L16 Arg81 hydroxylase